ncbi:spermine/spermidine synthase domain-containing protein [Methylomonas koyamae]|uniref:spermine/spermidine synthase domain-containing protein n=1 Tax=Methylomonas koyamae TaxID=702114 RepID=UPI00287349D4|nr:spermine synthase [Methylomonas koyamae]WNB74210.1 spermine synthase [Methylomonas koyamae]
MYKYEGLVIHQSHDDEGVIEVVENNGERALHFGSPARQSSMLIADPNRLHSFYARAMMALLLFNDNPRDVLMIGLGGGTIAKFMLHQFPDCRLKVVEFRSGVLKVARSHFGLPFNPRLKIKIGCGADHVRYQSRELSEIHDLIMVDAYDDSGMAPEVGSERFFDDCRNLLKKDGVLVINLWGTDKPMFQQVSWHLGRIFNWRMLYLPVRNRGNIIGFAFGENFPKPQFKSLIAKANDLERQYQLEFPVFLQDFKRNNPSILHRVLKP